MDILTQFRTAIREASRKVDGEWVVPLEVLKPIYEQVEKEAMVGLQLKDMQPVIRVDGAEVTYRLDQEKAGEMWEVMWG